MCETHTVNLNPTRIDIDGITGYDDAEGLYFDVNQGRFDNVFDTRLGQTDGIYSAKQCDEYGREIWSGLINVGRAYRGWYGRRVTGPAAGQWNVNDYIVRSNRGCVIKKNEILYSSTSTFSFSMRRVRFFMSTSKSANIPINGRSSL